MLVWVYARHDPCLKFMQTCFLRTFLGNNFFYIFLFRLFNLYWTWLSTQQVTDLSTIYIEAIVFSVHWKYDLFNLNWTWQDVDSYFWSINISWWSKWNQHFHYLGSTLSLNLSKWLKSLLAWSMISFNLRKGVFEKVCQQRVSKFTFLCKYFSASVYWSTTCSTKLVQNKSFFEDISSRQQLYSHFITTVSGDLCGNS